MRPLYTIGTWDTDLQEFTPQEGLSVPCVDVPLATMRQVLRELRNMGYTCHRRRDSDGRYDDNDFSVSVRRTDVQEVIEVFLEDGEGGLRGWMSTTNDPETIELFGTGTLPLPFLENTPADQVESVLKQLNPDARIVMRESSLS